MPALLARTTTSCHPPRVFRSFKNSCRATVDHAGLELGVLGLRAVDAWLSNVPGMLQHMHRTLWSRSYKSPKQPKGLYMTKLNPYSTAGPTSCCVCEEKPLYIRCREHPERCMGRNFPAWVTFRQLGGIGRQHPPHLPRMLCSAPRQHLRLSFQVSETSTQHKTFMAGQGPILFSSVIPHV